MTNQPGINKILENWKVVLLSFIGAATFWFFNALNKDYSAMVSYPIEFNITQDSIVIMEPLPETVQIDVSGGGWNLFRNTLWFSVDPIRVQLDNPTDIRFLTRSTLLPIVKDHLPEMDVNFLYSDTLYIHIEKKKVKKVKLAIDSANVNLESGHQIVSPIQINPPYVNIIGPETIINSLQESYYIGLPERRINNNINDDLTIPLPFDDIMSSDPKEVNIRFEVDHFDSKRITVPIERVNFPADSTYQLSDTVLTVYYVIQRKKDRDIDPGDFSISVDYNMLELPDSLIQPLIIYSPEDALDLEVSPTKIKLLPNE